MPTVHPRTTDELLRAVPSFIRRQGKHLRQASHGWAHTRRVGFVFGCQRSGTTMLMRVIDQVPEVHVFHENYHIAFDDYQLRSRPVVRTLIQLTPAPVQVFKPICDSHRASDILEEHPGACGVWIHRRAGDVANSAVVKWGDHQRQVMTSVIQGDTATWGWRTAGVSQDALQKIKDAASTGGELTDHEGALLFWWMRNQAYFDSGLSQDPRVLRVCYERLVEDPTSHFPRVFRHLGVPWSERFVETVRSSSVGRSPAPEARLSIQALVSDLEARLAAHSQPPLPLPKRLLVFIDTVDMGGAERYAITVANRLAEQGIDTTLVSAPDGDQKDRISDAVRHIEGPFDSVRGELPRAAFRFRQILEDTRPQAIVCNSLATTLVARGAQPWRAIPIVNVAHGWPEHRFKSVAPPMRVADRVVAVSPEVKRKLVAGGLRQERCEVVYNGVDCRPLGPREGELRERMRSELGATTSDDIIVLTVGRLEEQKAHQHIISVAKATATTHPHVRFAVVGGGSRRSELEQLVSNAGVTDRVRFLGLRTDVPDLLGAADFFFNCSDWEGMPLTTIEAMASGLPIVATHTEGADELLTPETGIVVPVADVPAMTRAIIALAEDAPRRTAAGVAARNRALAHFSHERMVAQLVDVVQTVLR